MAERGLTNAAMAKTLGVDHSTISRIRCGSRLPSLDLMRRTARAYDIDLLDVLDAQEAGFRSIAAFYNQIALDHQ